MTGLKIKDFEKYRESKKNISNNEVKEILENGVKNQYISTMDKINDHTSMSTTKTGTNLKQPTRSTKPLVIVKKS
jgi:hypothetical protein